MIKTCFIISAIGEEESETRKRANVIYEFMFEPILKDMGYNVTRSDKIGSAGLITREIVKQIINSDLIIADVSDENPNVFYELAIRNVVKKPVIVIKRAEQKMPFDIYDKRAIPLDTTKPRVWENAKKQLRVQIKDSEENPVNASESILSDLSFEFDREKKPKVEEDIQLELKDTTDGLKRLVEDLARQNKDSWYTHHTHDMIGMIVSIEPNSGSGVPIDKNQKLLVPDPIGIKLGQQVSWINNDSVSHTITSGRPSDNETGMIFNSGLIKPGITFTFTFKESGAFSYFDAVHPWIIGTVIVR